PARPAATLLREAEQLAREGAWAALCERVAPHVARLDGAAPEPRLVPLLATAAAEAAHAPALEALIGAAFAGRLAYRGLCRAAYILALGGQCPAALALLLSQPATLQGPATPEEMGALLNALRVLVFHAPDRVTRAAATALRRQVTGGENDRPDATSTLASGDSQRPPGPAPLLFNRAAIAAPLLEELDKVHTAFEAALPRREPPRLREYHDVFVNRLGQVWRPDGEVMISMGRPLMPGSREAMAGAPRGATAALGTDGAGFFHWMVEWLPGLIWAAGALPGTALLLRDDAPGYQGASLDLAAPGAPRLAVGAALRVERLLVTSRHMPRFRYWDVYAPGYARFLAEAERRAAPGPRPRRLYISRGDASRRPLRNEAALIAALEAEGFTSLELGPLGMAEQIATVAAAEEIVAPHGAGLAHLLGLPRPVRVLEIFPMLSGHMSLRYNFARIARLRGHAHALRLEPQPPGRQEWEVDIQALLADLAPWRATPLAPPGQDPA
ncbi:glycosyltransferase family 61 protein, partial [Roseomonas sp. GC11]|uniref:glycosyltransferase family 61 protein n=1 Tax=Roseomonas sp. GC11 TaxID=2950546 RepID=UPI00210C494A